MAKRKVVERRFERLRPEQFRKLRNQTPLAYLPTGILEWHGPQNPIGLDGIKAHGLCVRAAERTGGLVFPTIFWGTPPASDTLEVDHFQPHFPIAYGVPEDHFTTDRMRFGPALEQWHLYGRVFDQAMRVIARYGFKAILVLSGHYPLNYVRYAAIAFEREFGIPVWIGHEGMVCSPGQGDHAAQWETSLMWALEPETVDFGHFPKRGKPNPPGVYGKPVADITPALARANLERVLEGMEKTAKALLDRRKTCKPSLKRR